MSLTAIVTLALAFAAGWLVYRNEKLGAAVAAAAAVLAALYLLLGTQAMGDGGVSPTAPTSTVTPLQALPTPEG